MRNLILLFALSFALNAQSVGGGIQQPSFLTSGAGGNATLTVPVNTAGVGMSISNANGSLFMGTSTASPSSFAPQVLGNSATFAQPGLELFGNGIGDTGTAAMVLIRGEFNGGSVVTRPIFQLQNFATTLITVNPDGSTVIPQLKSTTGTRYVCVDTTGKLTSSATACSGT